MSLQTELDAGSRCDRGSRAVQVVVIAVEGELDVAAQQSFCEFVLRRAALGDCVVLDLSGVTFIDSAGIGTLLRLHRLFGRRGSLALAGPRPRCLEVLRNVQLTRAISVYPSVEEALEELDGG